MMPELTHTPPAPTPRGRIQDLGATLRTALLDVLTHTGGHSIRPIALSRALGLDDSLAARVLRAVRAGDSLSALREMPAPQGLRLFVDAAERAGTPPPQVSSARAVITEFESLLASLPLGRTSLSTAIDGWLPSGKAQTERAHKHAVHKAMAHTLGFTVDVACFAMAVQPSSVRDRCDTLTFVAFHGVRRLREGAPILLFANSLARAAADPSAQSPPQPALRGPAIESVDGEPEITDARKLLLGDVGDTQSIPLRLIERPSHTRLVLDAAFPPLHQAVTAACGYVTRGAMQRHRSPDRTIESLINVCKVPATVLVIDTLLHEDIYPAFAPNIAAHMDGIYDDPPHRDDEVADSERLDLDADHQRLGSGLDRVGVNEWAGYEGGLRSALRRARWDADRFRLFRCVIRHPYPFVRLTTIIDLPERPGPTGF